MSVTNLLENWSQFRHAHPVDDKPHEEYKWAMAIDLDACSGCNACSVACYAENNIPVVGKEKFNAGQQMHWIRIERYWDEDGSADQGAQFLPMMCQQCEAAPCETVCPAGATNHTADGVNSQIYNRCVGSRYCSANCPFKVRYFNWYDYPTTDNVWPDEMTQQLNPDVSVRGKGVMEKCTFCVQRMTAAKNTARNESRLVRDGEVQTACQQACPTNAISFGNLVDPESRVAKQWAHQQVELAKEVQAKDAQEGGSELRGYRIFEELRAYPSVMYLERVRESAI